MQHDIFYRTQIHGRGQEYAFLGMLLLVDCDDITRHCI